MENSLRKEMMKRLLVVLLFVISGNSYAEWMPIDNNDEFTSYVDRATIRRNGNLAKMWLLMDYKAVQKFPSGKSYLSQNSQTEYDCKEEKIRTLAVTFFSRQMGSGTVVYSDSDLEDKWSPISPGSIKESLWKIACGKR